MITVEIKNLDELKKTLEAYPRVSAKEINSAINKTLVHIQGEAMKKAPVDTGKLRSHWQLRVYDLEGYLRNKMKYAIFVHEGTKPHWVGKKHLQGWANRHGIPVFLVQRAIAKKGTKANPFLKKAIINSERELDRYFETALDNILKKI